MDSVKIFVAYASQLPEVGQTIRQAETDLQRYHANANVKLWEQLDIPGRFIAEAVLQSIEESDALVADITTLNFNVTYEIGFAIGRGKKISLVIYAPLYSAANDAREQIGIFDTLGYKSYQNSRELMGLFRELTAIPQRTSVHSYNKSSPLYLTEDRWRTDGATRIISRIKKARLPFRSFDPNEQPRLSALEAISQVSQSYGVLVHLVGSNRPDAVAANIRGAFIAGLAQGFERELLILQQGNDPVPLDYRDLVSTYTRPEHIDEYIAEFAGLVYEAAQGVAEPVTSTQDSTLWRMDLGASSAENEFRDLAEYYLPTEGFRRAQRGDVRLVLGRKGSGKTAIFLQVRNRLRSRKNVVLDFIPDGFRLVKFRDKVLSMLDRGTAEHAITALWEFLLFIELAHKILESDRELQKRDHALAGPYRDVAAVYRSYPYHHQGDFSERMSALLNSIENDFEAKYPNRDTTRLSLDSGEITALIHQKDIRELQTALVAYLRHKDSVWILFDNIDKGWASHGITLQDLVIVKGLIEATRKIERTLQQRDIEAHSLIFLRNDVYELLLNELPDRGKDTRAILDWTDPELLREVIRRRAAHAGCEPSRSFAELWSSVCVSHIDGEESSQYLIDRSLMRPRYLIDLINHCRGNALTLGHERIDQDDLRAGVTLLSRDLVSELSHEIRDVHSAAEDVVYAFTGCEDELSQEDIFLALMEAHVPDEHHERVLQLLLWYGFLGVLDDENEPKYIFQVQYNPKLLAVLRERRTSKAKSFQINPAFWPALGVRT